MLTPEDSETLFISAEEAGLRLDKVLAQRFEGKQSRTYFQSLIAQHAVLVNGQPVKKREKLQEGDEIEVCFVASPEIAINPEAIPLDILFEDEHLLVINKPVGMVVHPAPGNWSGTFVNALLYHCRQLQAGDSCRPGIVHRLDKDTSGLLLAAKTSQAQQRLITLFSERKVEKNYYAICLGNPGSLTINQPIGRHHIHRKMMTVREDGRPAISHIKTLAHNEKISWVDVKIETGRTHQIRVHLKYRGTPVLGDSLYGSTPANKQFHAARQMLHAYRLQFVHPITAETMEFNAPLPEDMAVFVRKLNDQ